MSIGRGAPFGVPREAALWQDTLRRVAALERASSSGSSGGADECCPIVSDTEPVAPDPGVIWVDPTADCGGDGGVTFVQSATEQIIFDPNGQSVITFPEPFASAPTGLSVMVAAGGYANPHVFHTFAPTTTQFQVEAWIVTGAGVDVMPNVGRHVTWIAVGERA